MKKLIAVLVAGLFAAATFAAFADDNAVKSGPVAKPAGRSIDDGTVKSGGTTAKSSRAADEQKPAPTTPSKKSSKKKKKQPQS
jgi:predicted ribosomally synthesized peptide with SipW-like signal peptide